MFSVRFFEQNIPKIVQNILLLLQIKLQNKVVPVIGNTSKLPAAKNNSVKSNDNLSIDSIFVNSILKIHRKITFQTF